jgi:menaquinone-specific isochorismate synthase
LCQGHSTLVYAGAGIVEGTNPSFEWDELDLKASQVSLSKVMDIIADIYLKC